VGTGKLGQNSGGRTAGTEHLGQDSWCRTTGTRQLGQNSGNRIGTEQRGPNSQVKTDRIGRSGNDLKDIMAWKGKLWIRALGQDSWNRRAENAGSGEPVHESLDRTAGTRQLGLDSHRRQ
jgi:hypothetical protein